MQRTKLRFLFTPVWISNIVVQFSLLYDIIPKTDGKLSLRWLSSISFLLLFAIILIKDIFIFRRVVFLRIISVSMLVFSMIYLVLIFVYMNMNSIFYLSMLIPTLISGLVILNKVRSSDL